MFEPPLTMGGSGLLLLTILEKLVTLPEVVEEN